MMNNGVHCEEEDDGNIRDSVSFDLQDENSYIIQLEQFPPLLHPDFTAMASDHLDPINYISQECSEIPNSEPLRNVWEQPHSDEVAGRSSCGRDL